MSEQQICEQKDKEMWIPMESNPEVMNKFLWSVGVPKEWSIVDIIGLDEDSLQFICGPVLAMILLFPRGTDFNLTQSIESSPEDDLKNVYSMRQTIGNACGTVAMIHCVANSCHQIKLKDNSSLKTFLDSSRDLSYEERGKLLESNEGIRSAHYNSAIGGQTAPPIDDRNNHHFVALVNGNGILYELGTKHYPVNYGKTSEDTFLFDAARVCRQFVSLNPHNNNFNALALSPTQD